MDKDTTDALERAHGRIDDLVKCVTRTAALQERLAEDIRNLAAATREALHHSPCRDLCQTMKTVEEMQSANRETHRCALESRRDWRRWLMDVFKLSIVAVGAALATRATEFWQWINSIRHNP